MAYRDGVRGNFLLMSGFGELVFTYTADGAYPIFGKVLEFCTGGYAIVGISY